MKPVEVFALNTQFNRMTGSIPYTSLQWDRRYYEPGQFELHVFADMYDPSWAYIYTDDRPETGIIQKREYDDSSTTPGGRDTIMLSGYFTERWLYDFTFLIEDDTDIEKTYIRKPLPNRKYANPDAPNNGLPRLYVTGTGEYYADLYGNGKLYDENGDPTQYSTNGMTEVEYDFAPGVTTWRPSGASGRIEGYVDQGANYFTEDGELHRISAATGKETVVDASDVIRIGNGSANFYVEDGKTYYFTQYFYSEEGTYIRRCERWEENTKALKKIYNGTIAVQEREVKGPFNLRTDLADIGKERDSVQAIITYAQAMWGNGMVYDEPDFEGETKVLDLNMRNFGEFVYDELAKIGASVRIFYAFESNATVFQIWRGRDCTQDTNAPKFEDEQEAAVLSVLAGDTDDYPVPDGYTQLLYIEATGTQYIDTGLKPNDGMRVVMDGAPMTIIDTYEQVGGYMFGAGELATGTLDAYVTTNFWTCVFGTRNIDGSQSTAPGVEVRIEVCKDYARITSSGSVVYDEVFPQAAFSGPKNLHIFHIDRDRQGGYFGAARCISFQVYDNGVLVRDFVPARRDADAAYGLYETVSGEFYENAGTGEFLSGPEIPRPEPEPEPEPVPDPGDDGTPWTVFSDTWGSMYGYRYSVDDSNYRNKCYVMYEYDEPMQYETVEKDSVKYEDCPKVTTEVVLGSDNPVDDEDEYGNEVEPHIPYTTKQGYVEVRLDDDYRDLEVALDLRSDKPDFDKDWPRDAISEASTGGTGEEGAAEEFDVTKLAGLKQKYEDWFKAYTEKGKTELNTNYPIERTLDTGTLSAADYMGLWDLGDVVDVSMDVMGVYETARVTGVDEVYESNGSSISMKIDVTLGEEKMAPLTTFEIIEH